MSELLPIDTLVPIVVDGSYIDADDEIVAGQICGTDEGCARGLVYDVVTRDRRGRIEHSNWLLRDGKNDVPGHTGAILFMIPEPLTIFHEFACEVVET